MTASLPGLLPLRRIGALLSLIPLRRICTAGVRRGRGQQAFPWRARAGGSSGKRLPRSPRGGQIQASSGLELLAAGQQRADGAERRRVVRVSAGGAPTEEAAAGERPGAAAGGWASAPSGRTPRSWSLGGMPTFMAPEVARGEE